ncbi:MAG: hypothetical protein ACRBBK_12525 [Paracoccaceae bacterium]
MTNSKKKMLFSFGAIFFVALGGILFESEAARAESCEEVLSQAPSELFITSEIYSYLRRLDFAECPTNLPEAFEAIVETRQLNTLSYSLLEGRLGEGQDALAPMLIAQFVEGYEQAQSGLDENAIMILIDLAYYPCAGDEACVSERLVGWTKGLRQSDAAQCLFGMPKMCEATGSVPFWNTVTVNAASSSQPRKARDAFLCARFNDCRMEGE